MFKLTKSLGESISDSKGEVDVSSSQYLWVALKKKKHALQALDSPVVFSPQKPNSHWNTENKLLRASMCGS